MAIVLPGQTTPIKPPPWNASQASSAAPNLWRDLRLFVPVWDVSDPQNGHYGWFDIVGRRQPTSWTVKNTPSVRVEKLGNAVAFIDAERVSVPAYSNAFTADTDFTFVITFRARAQLLDGGSLWARSSTRARGSSADVDWAVLYNGTVWRGRWVAVGDTNYDTDTTAAASAGDVCTAVLKRRGDNIYLDMIVNGAVTFGSATAITGTAKNAHDFIIGSDATGTGGAGAVVLSFGSWGRALTDTEIRQLAADPFVLIRPARHVLQVTAGGITGTLAVTEAADSLAASGTVTAPTFTGTLAVTEQADSLAASGTFVPNYTGTLAVTENADGLVASGTFVPGPISGTLILTEQPDTLAATGSTATSTGRRQDGGLVASRQGGTMTASRQEGGPV